MNTCTCMLPPVSKVFEYIMFDQLMTFLKITNFSVWNNSVSGLAIQKKIDYLTTEMDNSNVLIHKYS